MQLFNSNTKITKKLPFIYKNNLTKKQMIPFFY